MLSLVEMRNIAKSVAPTTEAHWRRLDFSSCGEYEDWCLMRGFTGGGGPKSFLRKLNEASVRYLELERDLRSARHFRSPEVLIEAICSGRLRHWEVRHRPLQAAAEIIQEAGLDDLEADALQHMLRCLSRQGPLMTMTVPDATGIPAMHALIALNDYRAWWVRPLEAWRPPQGSAGEILSSLVRHLLDRFGDVPRFMDSAWLRRDEVGAQVRAAYVQLGRGGSLKEAGLPAPLTRRMLHALRDAPVEYSVERAIRRAQALAHGLTGEALAALLDTGLARDVSEWAFWDGFVRFLAANPDIPPYQIGPLVDFVRAQRFGLPGLVVHEGAELQAPEEGFSLRGRTGASLIRQMEDWHRQLGAAQSEFVRFAKVRVEEIHVSASGPEGPVDWHFQRLGDSWQLAEEGRVMRHCVATRDDVCRSGAHSIWRVRRIAGGKNEHRLTLETMRNGSVVQVRGFANRYPTEEEAAAVRRFCLLHQEALKPGPKG
ncbi:MAG: PcfJ domain-containing protein [Hyphomonas sp.]|uniref:PcfJ domain-containing protein n=1 Tax=Hyphomonas sp. TaxID=87 RepID=UPI0035270496